MRFKRKHPEEPLWGIKRIWLGAATLIVVVVLVGSGVSWWRKINNNTEKPNEDKWIKYVNNDCGYYFEYPQNWTLNLNDPRSIHLISTETQKRRNDLKNRSYLMDDIIISCYENIKELESSSDITTLEDYVHNFPLFSKVKLIDFAGGRAWETTEGGYASSYTIMIEENGHLYEIQLGRWDKSYLSETDKQILSSFKFLHE